MTTNITYTIPTGPGEYDDDEDRTDTIDGNLDDAIAIVGDVCDGTYPPYTRVAIDAPDGEAYGTMRYDRGTWTMTWDAIERAEEG